MELILNLNHHFQKMAVKSSMLPGMMKAWGRFTSSNILKEGQFLQRLPRRRGFTGPHLIHRMEAVLFMSKVVGTPTRVLLSTKSREYM